MDWVHNKIASLGYTCYVKACSELDRKHGRDLGDGWIYKYVREENLCYAIRRTAGEEEKIPICPVQPCSAGFDVNIGCIVHGPNVTVEEKDAQPPTGSLFDLPPTNNLLMSGTFVHADIRELITKMKREYNTDDMSTVRECLGRLSYYDVERGVVVSIPKEHSKSLHISDLLGRNVYKTCAGNGGECIDEGIKCQGNNWYCSENCIRKDYVALASIDHRLAVNDLMCYFKGSIDEYKKQGMTQNKAMNVVYRKLVDVGHDGIEIVNAQRKYELKINEYGGIFVTALDKLTDPKKRNYYFCQNLLCLSDLGRRDKDSPSHSTRCENCILKEEKQINDSLLSHFNSTPKHFVIDKNI